MSIVGSAAATARSAIHKRFDDVNKRFLLGALLSHHGAARLPAS